MAYHQHLPNIRGGGGRLQYNYATLTWLSHSQTHNRCGQAAQDLHQIKPEFWHRWGCPLYLQLLMSIWWLTVAGGGRNIIILQSPPTGRFPVPQWIVLYPYTYGQHYLDLVGSPLPKKAHGLGKGHFWECTGQIGERNGGGYVSNHISWSNFIVYMYEALKNQEKST